MSFANSPGFYYLQFRKMRNILSEMKRKRSLAVRLVKAASREHIGNLPKAQVLPRKPKPGRDRVKDDA